MKNYLLLLLFCSPFFTNAQSLYFPPNNSDEWATTDPEELGYCADQVDELYDFLEQTNSKAFILLKDGRIVLEKYFDDFNQDKSWLWNSVISQVAHNFD